VLGKPLPDKDVSLLLFQRDLHPELPVFLRQASRRDLNNYIHECVYPC